MAFFGSGRYREQLKLLYKVTKLSAAMQVPLGGLGGLSLFFFEHRDTEAQRI